MVIQSVRWLSLFLMLLGSKALFAASIHAEVDRNIVQEDESFNLMLSSDAEVDAAPDFSVLEKDFRILNRSQSSNIQIINGKMSREMKWQLILMPKRSGQLLIPSIEFGDDKSSAVALKVIAAKPGQSNKVKDLLYMETEVDRQSAFVQAQIIYTIRIYHALALNLVNASLSDLEISDSDAIVEKLVENNTYNKIVNGKQYKVFEKKFALFAQKSGDLIIEPAVFEGQYVDRRRTLHTKRLRSKEYKIDILPISSQFLASNQGRWLPAKNLELSENWPDNVTEVKVGEPITRTLTMVANGLMSTQLPEINQAEETEAIKQYTDQPKLDDDKSDQGFVARREEKIAYLPSKPGAITLPAIEVPWWNTQTKTQEFARLPARTIQVVPAPGSVTVGTPANSLPQENRINDDGSANLGASLSPMTHGVVNGAPIWFWVSVTLFVIWVITLFGWRMSLSRARYGDSTLAVNKSANNENKKRLLKRLKSACQQNAPEQVKATLIEWGKHQWPDNPPMSIGHIAERVDQALAKELVALNAALYSQGDNNWNGILLWQGIQQLSANNKSSRQRKQTVIKPLFRIVTADS